MINSVMLSGLIKGEGAILDESKPRKERVFRVSLSVDRGFSPSKKSKDQTNFPPSSIYVDFNGEIGSLARGKLARSRNRMMIVNGRLTYDATIEGFIIQAFSFDFVEGDFSYLIDLKAVNSDVLGSFFKSKDADNWDAL